YWGFTFTRPQAFCMALTEDDCIKHFQKLGHRLVYMDIEIAGEAAGRLLFELFTDICPKTSKNFEDLCTGVQGLSQSGFPLCYKGSLFHRVVPGGWVQGGDISPERKGNGGESIYGPTFEDESFAISHSKRGMLGMANKGPHRNGSQFYITLQPTMWMDRTYVAFGQMVEGVDVLKRLEEVPTCNDRPKYECKVTDCGVLKL
uniref:Peptidyl-prolyl cis-trans isomerase n=3 Tax=Scophthalmus maximus TaxID=52904 RepID=A0A8D3B281_SCOMX